VDIARGIAIIGMFVLHAIPAQSSSPILSAGTAIFSDQRAQILFATLDGISIGILTGFGSTSRASNGGEIAKIGRFVERQTIAIRGLYLVTLGLFLTTLGSPIVVILDYYGIYFLLVLPFVYMKKKTILGISLTLLIVGPYITHLARQSIGDPSVTGNEYLPPLIERIASWTLVGQYPAIIWLGYVFLGLAVYRIGILDRNSQIHILKVSLPVGLFMTAAGHGLLLNEISKQTITLFGSAGVAISIVLAATFFADGNRIILRKFSRTFLYPISALGGMPITIYFFHVIYFAFLMHYLTLNEIQSGKTFSILLIASVIFSVICLQFVKRGPMELAISQLLPQRTG